IRNTLQGLRRGAGGTHFSQAELRRVVLKLRMERIISLSRLRLAGFHHTDNLRTNDRCWGVNRFEGNLLEPSMFKLDPALAVGVAAITQSLPKRRDQILNAPQARSSRRSDMLDKHKFAAGS